jgi:DNA-binding response OmpR family regulator
MAKKILVIEDDPGIADLVAFHLGDLGCDMTVVADGLEGLDQARSRPFDLIVLDVMLPGADGFDICQTLRAEQFYAPILMLTARSADLDRVLGLELGADDYITKPFNVQELRARVKALFRRVDAPRADAASRPLHFVAAGDVALDGDRRTVTVAGRPIALTIKEFDLLAHFVQHPGRVYTRSQLLDLVWGYGNHYYAHTVNSHINRLRAKLEPDPAHSRYILTAWGLWYKFRDAE